MLGRWEVGRLGGWEVWRLGSVENNAALPLLGIDDSTLCELSFYYVYMLFY